MVPIEISEKKVKCRFSIFRLNLAYRFQQTIINIPINIWASTNEKQYMYVQSNPTYSNNYKNATVTVEHWQSRKHQARARIIHHPQAIRTGAPREENRRTVRRWAQLSSMTPTKNLCITVEDHIKERRSHCNLIKDTVQVTYIRKHNPTPRDGQFLLVCILLYFEIPNSVNLFFRFALMVKCCNR